jgi:hypothetical protein
MWESSFGNGEQKANLLDSRSGVFMFTDLFHLINSMGHDYREEKGRKVHAYDCRRCALRQRTEEHGRRSVEEFLK